MDVISSKSTNRIIRKTLSIVNNKIMKHGEIVGYILYKMLQSEHLYSDEHLADYMMLGILHDIGLYKEGDLTDVANQDISNPWPHSIYGFLFLKYLSPLGDKAEIVLYHHLDYNRYSLIKSQYLHIIECLSLADKMDNFMRMKKGEMQKDYFIRYKDIKFSGKALALFWKAEEEYHIMASLSDESYKQELEEVLSRQTYTEQYKKKFLEMLVYTIDFRSEYTVLHTIATVNFSQQIGRLMHIQGQDIRNLYYGAMLHDIGKLAIPVSILESPGKLSVEEMRIMKAHVRITEMILEDEISQEVLEIAIRHHEKLDGSGYHKGLKEEDMTLPQMILGVADIFSALYGRRSYKESFDGELIKKILVNEADHKRINKKVVNCVVKNYDQIISKFEKEKEETVDQYLNIIGKYNSMCKRFEKINNT